jgi:hypothetical protein
MQFNTELGIIVIATIILIFVIRIIFLQVRKANLRNHLAGKSRRAIKRAAEKGKIPAVPHKGLRVVSWYLILLAVLMIGGGVAIRFTGLIFKDWWWVIVSAGVVIMGISVY